MSVGDGVHHVEAAVLAARDKPNNLVLDSRQRGRRITPGHGLSMAMMVTVEFWTTSTNTMPWISQL